MHGHISFFPGAWFKETRFRGSQHTSPAVHPSTEHCGIQGAMPTERVASSKAGQPCAMFFSFFFYFSFSPVLSGADTQTAAGAKVDGQFSQRL